MLSHLANHLKWVSSAASLSGYNTAPVDFGFSGEWPNWLQAGCSGTLYVNPLPGTPANTQYYTASDGALGTVGGLTGPANVTVPGDFVAQSGIVAKLPAVVFPPANRGMFRAGNDDHPLVREATNDNAPALFVPREARRLGAMMAGERRR